MDRNCRVIGFLGIDKQEYMMYLSRVLYHLGKKVLLVDYSETGALSSSIPSPKGIRNTVIESRGVMFLDNRNSKEEVPLWQNKADIQDAENDFALIDYGFCTGAIGLSACEQLVLVTDQQAHNINRLAGLDYLKEMRKSLVIKNVVSCRITRQYIAGELKLEGPASKQTYMIYQDEVDTKCRINSQYDGIFRFAKLSSQSKNMIKGLIVEILPEITKKQLKEAYKKAEKGA